MQGAPRFFRPYVAMLLAAGCAHAVVPEPAPSPAAQFAAFAQALPACGEGQAGLTVEQVYERDWRDGDCVLVRGRLLLDTEPLMPEPGDGNRPMLAAWIVLGAARPIPAAARATMEGPYRKDEHVLYVDSDYSREQTPDLCAEDDAGELRMPVGQLLRFPLVHRERPGSPAAGPAPTVPVVILGQIHEYADRSGAGEIRRRLVTGSGFDISRICRARSP